MDNNTLREQDEKNIYDCQRKLSSLDNDLTEKLFITGRSLAYGLYELKCKNSNYYIRKYKDEILTNRCSWNLDETFERLDFGNNKEKAINAFFEITKVEPSKVVPRKKRGRPKLHK